MAWPWESHVMEHQARLFASDVWYGSKVSEGGNIRVMAVRLLFGGRDHCHNYVQVFRRP